MKYNIFINQKSCVDLKLNLDIIDLAIYDCIKAFAITDSCVKITINNIVYFWMQPGKIKEELPLLGITTTRGISKRIDKLIESGLLERCPDNQSLQKTFLKFGSKASEYEFCTTNESSKHLEREFQVPMNESSNDNNTIYNNTIYNNKSKSESDDSIIPTPQQVEVLYPYETESTSVVVLEKPEKVAHTKFDFVKALIDIGVSEEYAKAWVDIRKKKKATNSEIAFKLIRSEFEKSYMCGMQPNDCVEYAIKREWKGFEYSWVENDKNRNNHGTKNQRSDENKRQIAKAFYNAANGIPSDDEQYWRDNEFII